jgi:hypothetical protein
MRIISAIFQASAIIVEFGKITAIELIIGPSSISAVGS